MPVDEAVYHRQAVAHGSPVNRPRALGAQRGDCARRGPL